MPRKPRKKSISDIYHVTNRGVNHLSIFAQNREKGRMLNLIRENCDKYQVGIYSYCIMPNHFHLLIKANLSDLSAFIAVISSKYASYYNYKHKRSGVVFQNRFQSQCIEDANYFWNCLRYIHLNPLKAKLCKDPRSYKYGSMNELCKVRQNEILDKDVYKKIKEFFGTAEQFWMFHNLPDNSNKLLFIDIKEEEFNQMKEIAVEILKSMSQQYKESMKEILEYAARRSEFDRRMKITLNISQCMVENIRKQVLEEI